MGLLHLARQAFKLSPGNAFAKGGNYAYKIVRAHANQVLNFRRSTYVPFNADGDWLSHDFGDFDKRVLLPLSQALLDYAASVSGHNFDLLGSGRIKVAQAASPRPISPGNRARSNAIGNLIDEHYTHIDWQLDFKSGYRWREDRLSGTLRYGHEPGVDVKVPWELARLQHLPALALAFRLDSKAGFEREFRNQVLDFAAANPPGYGVNWMCPMDVAIRAANLVLAMDLFCAFGSQFDEAFLAEFQALIQAHGIHVVRNLEWHELHRGNHYLANICGLLFIAAYLPRTDETAEWMTFSIDQLISEVERQFSEDGANFEASTSYHRLSTEMVVYATALALGLDDSPSFPPWYFERLERMAEFSLHVTKPNGRIVQIGDNDNGRFISICPSGDAEHLDHRSCVGAVNALFGRQDFAQFADHAGNLTGAVVGALAKGRTLKSYLENDTLPAAYHNVSDRCEGGGGNFKTLSDTVIELPDKTVLGNLETLSYADFGLFIWRTPRFFLSVRCGPIGQNGKGGHAHNDQLAIELTVDGDDWIADPGTYLYTPSPQDRDAYRSVAAHAAPRIGDGEPAKLTMGMFCLENSAQARCTLFSDTQFQGSHNGFGPTLRRRVFIGEGVIRIVDDVEGENNKFSNPADPVVIRDGQALRDHFSLSVAFSPGYGLQSGRR